MAFVSAVVAIVEIYHPLPPALAPALIALVGVTAPLVTLIASRLKKPPPSSST